MRSGSVIPTDHRQANDGRPRPDHRGHMDRPRTDALPGGSSAGSEPRAAPQQHRCVAVSPVSGPPRRRGAAPPSQTDQARRSSRACWHGSKAFWHNAWSQSQVSRAQRREFPDRPDWHLSSETIYLELYRPNSLLLRPSAPSPCAPAVITAALTCASLGAGGGRRTHAQRAASADDGEKRVVPAADQ